MKKYIMLLCLLAQPLLAGDLIFKAGFENRGLVSGTVNGLTASGLSLSLNFGPNSEFLTIEENGSFTFFGEVIFGTTWTVAINSQPAGQSCSLQGNFGVMAPGGANILIVDCGDGSNNWDEMNWNQGNWQ